MLTVIVLTACTSKQKAEPPKELESAVAISDPTPPDPPNSVEVQADLKTMPTMIVLAIGGIADEGEKEGVDVQENVRMFRTESSAQEILAFYAKEMKDRGWTTDNQVAKSGKVGLAMQEYHHSSTDAMYLIISEPEDPKSSDPREAMRHVALLPATVKKAKL